MKIKSAGFFHGYPYCLKTIILIKLNRFISTESTEPLNTLTQKIIKLLITIAYAEKLIMNDNK